MRNNSYQLRDYPCLYYLSGRLNLDDQCRFLSGLGSIFGLKASSISNSSILFAHASAGLLYEGNGFKEEDVTRLASSILDNPYHDCRSLCTWSALKKIKIKQECCTFCPLSTTYLNARLESEKLCIRYTIQTGKLAAPEATFTSVLPIAAGNDLSTYPTIPLYSLMNNFFITNDPHGPYHKEELIDTFSKYVCDKLSYTDVQYIKMVTECVKRELNLLFTYDFTSLTKNEINISHLNLLAPYKYEAPKIVHPDLSLDNAKGIPDREKKVHKPKTNNVKQPSIIPQSNALEQITIKRIDNDPIPEDILEIFPNNACEDTPHINVSKEAILQDNTSSKENIMEPPLPISEVDRYLDNNTINNNREKVKLKDMPATLIFIENKDTTGSLIEDISQSNNMDIVPIEVNINSDIMNTECILSSDMLNTESKDNASDLIQDEQEKQIDMNFPLYFIPPKFSSIVNNCSNDDAKSVLQFFTDTCKSHYLSIESVVFNERQGLLILTSSSLHFYYFDLEYASSGYLHPALSDASKLKFLSLNPLPVYSMLKKLGFSSIRIESLTGLYSVYNKINNINDYSTMFDEELSIQNKDNLDFYQYYMPHYETFYNSITKKFEDRSDKEFVGIYENGIRLDEVLGANYDLNTVLYQFNQSILGHGFFDYEFAYHKEIPFIKKGIMYIVNIPSFSEAQPEKIKKFFEKVCIGVYKSPFKCIQSSILLSISETAIMYYTVLDGDLFLDILLDVIRRLYRKNFNELPILKTYRVEYK